MGKVKKFFSDINKSKFKSLYVKNFLFAVSILIVVLFAAITFNDIWLNIIGIFVLFGFSYLTFNVRAIEQNKLYEEVTGVITGYKEKAKADVLTPRLISEECSYVKGTNIDYPVVQGKTNQSYLHTNFKKQYTYGGCIFLDSKDNKQFALNDNNVFYGHHMRNGSMFADLVKFREEKFARKHTIELYTPDKTYHLKAFSAYAKTADTSIPITFKNQEEKNAYITKLKNRNGVSSIIKNIPKKDEPIYTFATCSYEGHDYRTYVHAVEK